MITIIGILAVAVLAAINPVEQIRRAQDSGVESDQAELESGMERYYTESFQYPWDKLGQSAPSQTLVQTSWLNELVSGGEVKSEFVNRSSWSKVYVTLSGTEVRICFAPTSNTFQKQANAAGKNRDGSSGCTSNCYDCMPR